MPGWKDATRRNLIGSKHELVAVKGELWIRPKKWSIQAADEIASYRRELFADPERRRKIQRIMELKKGEEIDIKTLEEAEGGELLELLSALELQDRRSIYAVGIRDGVGEHNFSDDAGELIGNGQSFDQATIDDILTWGELATEMFGVIQEYNRPLAGRNGDNSETSLKTSTAVPGEQ